MAGGRSAGARVVALGMAVAGIVGCSADSAPAAPGQSELPPGLATCDLDPAFLIQSAPIGAIPDI